MNASLASASVLLRVLSTAILARSPTMQCWSAPCTTSCRLAVVGTQRVCTRILLSPLLLVYSRAAWKLTSLLSFRSSSMATYHMTFMT